MRQTSSLVSLPRRPSVQCHSLPPPKGPYRFSPPFFPVVLFAQLANGDTIFRILVVPLWVCICKENLKIERSHRKMREQEAGSKKSNSHKRHKKLQNVSKRQMSSGPKSSLGETSPPLNDTAS